MHEGDFKSVLGDTGKEDAEVWLGVSTVLEIPSTVKGEESTRLEEGRIAGVTDACVSTSKGRKSLKLIHIRHTYCNSQTPVCLFPSHH